LIERIYGTYMDKANIYVVYIREAHPADPKAGRDQNGAEVHFADPKTLEERASVARDFATQFRVSVPILVDTIDDKVQKDYSAWPDRAYVIDAEGRIAFKGQPGPAGYHVLEVPPVLDRLLGVSFARTFPQDERSAKPNKFSKPGGKDSPMPMKENLSTMLARLGLGEEEAAKVSEAVERKIDAFRGLMEARRALVESVLGKGDAHGALSAYHESYTAYEETAKKIDDELDAALELKKKPQVLAGLTALGVVGSFPAPPLVGVKGPGDWAGGKPRVKKGE